MNTQLAIRENPTILGQISQKQRSIIQAFDAVPRNFKFEVLNKDNKIENQFEYYPIHPILIPIAIWREMPNGFLMQIMRAGKDWCDVILTPTQKTADPNAAEFKTLSVGIYKAEQQNMVLDFQDLNDIHAIVTQNQKYLCEVASELIGESKDFLYGPIKYIPRKQLYNQRFDVINFLHETIEQNRQVLEHNPGISGDKSTDFKEEIPRHLTSQQQLDRTNRILGIKALPAEEVPTNDGSEIDPRLLSKEILIPGPKHKEQVETHILSENELPPQNHEVTEEVELTPEEIAKKEKQAQLQKELDEIENSPLNMNEVLIAPTTSEKIKEVSEESAVSTLSVGVPIEEKEEVVPGLENIPEFDTTDDTDFDTNKTSSSNMSHKRKYNKKNK